jgi:hypothetical protein
LPSCPKCGQHNPNMATWCVNCGGSVSIPKKKIPNKEVKSEQEVKKLSDDADDKSNNFWNSLPGSYYLAALFILYVLWSNNLFDDLFFFVAGDRPITTTVLLVFIVVGIYRMIKKSNK